MRLMKLLPYYLLLHLLFVVSCSQPEKPVTAAEAATFAKELEAVMASRNEFKYSQLMDAEAFKKRIREQSNNKLDGRMIDGAIKGLKNGSFGSQLVGSLGKTGTYRLVKQYEKGNHQHLLFRMNSEELNYHDYELIKKGEQVKIADMYIYTTGQNLTTTFTESLTSMSAQTAAMERLDKTEVDKVERIKKYLNSKQYEKARSLYQTLPRIIRDQRVYKMIYIRIASGLGTDEYLKALSQFQQDYPDASNIFLLMIDAYFLKKDYDGALKSVNQLDSVINKDPFLDYYRGLLYKQKEDTEHQLFYLEQLHKNMPDLPEGMLQLIDCYLDQQQTGKAVALTKQYKKSKQVDTESLETLYAAYPDYKKALDAAGD